MANIVMRSFGGVAAVGAGAAASVSVASCASDKDKATEKEKKEATKISNTFDPEALERGAKALREINASPYAKKVRADAHHTLACILIFAFRQMCLGFTETPIQHIRRH